MYHKSQWTIDIPDCSLPTLLFKSATHPLPSSNPVFLDAENPSEHFLTLDSYRLLSQRLAAGLRNHGFQPSDRLLLFSGNNIYFPSVLMGTIMSGGIFTGANPTYVARELAHQLQNSDSRFLLCAAASLDMGLDAAAQISFPTDHIFYFDNTTRSSELLKGCRHWSTLLASPSEGRKFEWDPCDKPGENERTVVLNYSSGTTGVPKGVEVTHRNYIANCLNQKLHRELYPDFDKSRDSVRWIGFLPMYHALGQSYYAATGPLMGFPIYMMPKFDFERMMAYIEKFRITSLTIVPPVVVGMAKHPDVRRWKWDLSSIQDVTAGAAPLGRAACEEFESLFEGKPQEGKINVQQGWGMTEATCTITMCDPKKIYLTAAVGELTPNGEAKIVKEDGSGLVGKGERGEIWFRGPGNMKGYWRNDKATKETMTSDGWLMTGDIAYADDAGNFYIVDRKKELIKVKGNQVAPAELEALLIEHPAVTDAAVIGIPRDGDEAPRAYIVRTAGYKTSAEEIEAFVQKRVSKTKWLTGGVRFVDAIPKNPSGKILRRFLRDKAQKEDQTQAKL